MRIRLNEWGGNARSGEPGQSCRSTVGSSSARGGDRCDAQSGRARAGGVQPTCACLYSRAPRCELDLDGDGRAEVTLATISPDSVASLTGLFPVESRCFGADGITSRRQFWIAGDRAARAQRHELSSPRRSRRSDRPSVPLTAQAVSYNAGQWHQFAFRLDGDIASDFTRRSRPRSTWQALETGCSPHRGGHA